MGRLTCTHIYAQSYMLAHPFTRHTHVCTRIYPANGKWGPGESPRKGYTEGHQLFSGIRRGFQVETALSGGPEVACTALVPQPKSPLSADTPPPAPKERNTSFAQNLSVYFREAESLEKDLENKYLQRSSGPRARGARRVSGARGGGPPARTGSSLQARPWAAGAGAAGRVGGVALGESGLAAGVLAQAALDVGVGVLDAAARGALQLHLPLAGALLLAAGAPVVQGLRLQRVPARAAGGQP